MAEAGETNELVDIMTAADDLTPTFAGQDLMGAMIVALDIDVKRLSHPGNRVLVQYAVARCAICASTGACRRWLGGAPDDPAGHRDFCPNAGLFDRFAAEGSPGRPNRLDQSAN